MEPDVILNGVGSGSVAKRLLDIGFSANSLRPYIAEDGKTYITVFNGTEYVPKPIANTDATLRKDEWTLLDRAVVAAAKPRLRAISDLQSRGLVYNLPNGMGTTVLQTQTQSDITEAIASMDGLRRSEEDRPEFGLTNLPLPILHKDFSFTARELAVSRNGGAPLDTTTAELAARRVSELAESLLMGTYGTYQFGGGSVYGYLNYTYRNTYTSMKAWNTYPTVTGADMLADVLGMIAAAKADYHFGPFVLYLPSNFAAVTANDFKATGNATIRERLLAIEEIEDVRTLDYLTASNCILVEMQSDTVRLINGMNIQTVQWESHGGMRLDFKVMCIMVPQIRSDHNNNCGVVHGTVGG
jgi:hypothetical protein